MAKRVTQVGIRFTDAERATIRRIARFERRADSAVVRLLLERGIRQYEKDRLLIDPDQPLPNTHLPAAVNSDEPTDE